MNKNVFTYSLIFTLILFIIIGSVILIVDSDNKNNKVEDVYSKVVINDKELNITYYEGNKIDLNISYGNIMDKYIRIDNTNDEDIVYSLKYVDSHITYDDVTFSAFVKYGEDEYIEAVSNASLKENSSLVHNLIIKGHSYMTIKIVFKSMHENDVVNIKGELAITDNISSMELFNNTIHNINDAIEDRISKLNGIYQVGYYITNINELSFNNDANLSGYVLIDAKDISDIKYIYTVYNDKYMVKNNEYKSINIQNVDSNYVNTLTVDIVCHQYNSKITCSSFSTIPKSASDDKRDFFNKSKTIINEYSNIKVEDDKTYIYDVDQNGITGYVIINKDNLFLYIKNDLFMISGYNYKKLGDFDIKSKTIRSYNETAWNLSAKDKKQACSFSGFNECVDKEGTKV